MAVLLDGPGLVDADMPAGGGHRRLVDSMREIVAMLYFRNDYGAGAHPAVLEALCRTNLEPRRRQSSGAWPFSFPP